MRATGSLLVASLLSLLRHRPSLAFSLKNCTIDFSHDADDLSVTCEQRDLTAVPDDIPRNTTSLDLIANKIVNIGGTDLQGLWRLISAHFQSNSISHIEDGAFADLLELTTLSLDGNQLVNVTDHMFHGLSKLVTLTLSSNSISYISPGAFRSLLSLQNLDLDHNQLCTITDIASIFKLPTLKMLLIGYNKFTTFQSDDLPLNTSSLRLLGIHMNPLRRFSIKRDLFPSLELLYLIECEQDVEWDVANKTFLRNLISLNLAGDSFSFQTYRAVLTTADSLENLTLALSQTRIDEGLVDIACQITSLRFLELQVYDLHTLDDKLLRFCSRLTELSLYNNNFYKLSDHSLRSMTRLRILILDNNHLSRMPLAVQEISTLEILNLESNQITDLHCNDFLNMTSLLELNLKQNYISTLRGCVFRNLNNLKVLNIEGNSVFTFGNTFKFNLHKLETLNLQKNSLITIGRQAFTNLSSLRSLDLMSDTLYSTYNGAFEGLDGLQNLSLLLNELEKDIFASLPNLESLTVHLTWGQSSSQQNKEPPFSNLPLLKTLTLRVINPLQLIITPDLLRGLTSLENFMSEKFFKEILHQDTFKYTPRLKSLQILHSDLTHLSPEVFLPIPDLQTLDLSNNKFSYVDFLGRAGLEVLRGLKLRENSLSVINEAVFQALPALTYLDLMGNPLTCECSNSGFNQWVQSSNQTQVVNAHQYTCAFPMSQQGHKFLDFDIQSCWIDISFLCFLSSTCLILLTLFTSFTYHFLRWHLTYAYYLFLAFLYDKRRTKKGTAHHYDAFISYNIHDEAWVYREMLPALEGQQGWRLCLHHRDFEPGKPIVENITEAIYSSRKTICVISRHYLQSEWCSREIQMASFRLFDEQQDVLIMLFMEDIPACQLSPYYRMRSLLRRRSYLSWPQAGEHADVFWQNVRQALGADEKRRPRPEF